MTSTPTHPDDQTRARVLVTSHRATKAPAISFLAVRQKTNETLSFEAAGHGPIIITEEADPLAFRPPEGEELLAVAKVGVMVTVYEIIQRRFRPDEGMLVTILDSFDATILVTTERLIFAAFRDTSAETTLLNEETAAIATEINLDANLHLNFTAQACSYRRSDITELTTYTKEANGADKIILGDNATGIAISPHEDGMIQLSTDGGGSFQSSLLPALAQQLQG